MGYAPGVMSAPNLPIRAFIDYVTEAERHGFDEVWFAEDCFLKGGIGQAAVALASTSRIVVGVGILPAGARNVAFAALEIAFLANLYPGRLMVGIGHGMADWMRQVGAHPSSPLTLLREYLQALYATPAASRRRRRPPGAHAHGVRPRCGIGAPEPGSLTARFSARPALRINDHYACSELPYDTGRAAQGHSCAPMLRVTTAPAPMTLLSPMEMPAKMIALASDPHVVAKANRLAGFPLLPPGDRLDRVAGR